MSYFATVDYGLFYTLCMKMSKVLNNNISQPHLIQTSLSDLLQQSSSQPQLLHLPPSSLRKHLQVHLPTGSRDGTFV